MKRIFNCLALLLMLVALGSCKKDGKSLFTPNSSGTPYEVLVVMDETMWNDTLGGKALFDVLDRNVPGLPQAERSFRISQIDPSNFRRGFKVFRNIVMPNIDEIFTQPKFKFSRNVYAAPQMILTIQAPDEKSFAEYVTKHGQVIIDFFTKTEMNRQINLLKNKHNEFIGHKVDSIFGCEVWIPLDLQKFKKGKDFLWASTDRSNADLNFVMYSYPYTDKETFTKEYFLHKRDSVMKINLPGAREGMYMSTDSMYVDVKDINVRNEYAFEARGLWQMEGDMMGGPFVSHARVDRPNGRVVVVEGFVYSPKGLKRNLIRQMEAVLYTLTLPQEQQLEEIVIGPEVVEEEMDTTLVGQ